MAQLHQQAIVGYRFHPTDEELINYLKSKVTGCRETFCIIPTLENIYGINPWDLPAEFNEKSIVRSQDHKWWFICPQTQNQRISRKTPCGRWKITSKRIDIEAKNDDRKIGSKRTLVFIDGRKSNGTRSNWVMQEFHPHPDDMGFVLCCLKMKQEDKSCDIMDFDNPEEQFPFAEHHVQAMESQLNELFTKGSSKDSGFSLVPYQGHPERAPLLYVPPQYVPPQYAPLPPPPPSGFIEACRAFLCRCRTFDECF